MSLFVLPVFFATVQKHEILPKFALAKIFRKYPYFGHKQAIFRKIWFSRKLTILQKFLTICQKSTNLTKNVILKIGFFRSNSWISGIVHIMWYSRTTKLSILTKIVIFGKKVVNNFDNFWQNICEYFHKKQKFQKTYLTRYLLSYNTWYIFLLFS